MGSRPATIEIRSRSHGPLGADSDPSLRPLPSPRLHVAGDVPPELSPLDAFAAQSRLLAKKLEEGMRGEKRMSRLPPLSVEGAFVVPRPGYIRSASAHDTGNSPAEPASSNLGSKFEIESASLRPVSVHPRMSKIPGFGPQLNISHTHDGDDEPSRGRKPAKLENITDARTEISPEPISHLHSSRIQNHHPSLLSSRPSIDSTSHQRPDSFRYDIHALAPPRSPFSPKMPSPRSTSVDCSDEDSYASTTLSERPNLRKFSSSSGLSTSPISPLIPRSPSVCSDVSASTNRLSRPAFNFSRPLSRAEPVSEMPMRQASTDSDQLFLKDETTRAPLNMLPGASSTDTLGIEVPSGVSSSLSLPRGNTFQRDSSINPKFDVFNPNSIEAEPQNADAGFKPVPSQTPSPSTNTPQHQPSPSPQSGHAIIFPSSVATVTSLGLKDHGLQPGADGVHVQSFQRKADSSPLVDKPPLSHAIKESNIEGSAEWHVTKGIDCHERGSLNESTYHLRIAARLNHPTGMLLYALACRHGWGMRANQQEGVQWLRKAADLAILEVADDENSVKEGQVVDFVDQKTRKAQFALSVCELGVSHLNGWGIEQDKVLALRCFEIAGAWGDGDALAEAGFCYAQGIGCKKDMKKSAKFYRMAESKGISMVGNSWIHKSKYKEDAASDDTSGPKKDRNKSQARSIFARKKMS